MKKMLIIIPLLVIIISITIYIYKYNKNIFNNNYSETVITMKEIKLYDKNNNVIGLIKPNTKLNLETKTNNLYKIKDSEYYIDYRNVKKEETFNIDKLYIFNKDIITNDTFNLYQNDELKLTINNSMTFNIYKELENEYTVYFLNQYFEIKQEDIKEIKENINTDVEYTTYIPVLYFVDIINNNNYNDSLRESRYNEIITYLKEQNLNYINTDQYNLWINGNINLPKNSILLTSNKEDITNNMYQIDKEIDINNEASKLNNKSAYKINNLITISDIKEMLKGNNIIEVKIDDSKYATSIPVLNYHFFYGNGEICNEIICLHTDKLEEHFKYLNDNGYKTLTMKEYIDWYNKKIELPEKSILITIDDGAMGTDNHLPRLLEQYQIQATLFLVTAWWPKEKYVSSYLEIESHGHDIHLDGDCGKEKLLCLNLEEKINDFQKSINLLGTKQAFCYPFYEYDNESFTALKEVGFEVAFWGGGYNSTRNNNRYLIPRHVIFSDITLQEFIEIIN